MCAVRVALMCAVFDACGTSWVVGFLNGQKNREKILLEKEGSGCKVLLANDKSDDLSRMYRLFNRLPKGLEPMAEIIKDHITEVGRVQAREGWAGRGGGGDVFGEGTGGLVCCLLAIIIALLYNSLFLSLIGCTVRRSPFHRLMGYRFRRVD